MWKRNPNPLSSKEADQSKIKHSQYWSRVDSHWYQADQTSPSKARRRHQKGSYGLQCRSYWDSESGKGYFLPQRTMQQRPWDWLCVWGVGLQAKHNSSWCFHWHNLRQSSYPSCISILQLSHSRVWRHLNLWAFEWWVSRREWWWWWQHWVPCLGWIPNIRGQSTWAKHL